jgi:hypothetical protein
MAVQPASSQEGLSSMELAYSYHISSAALLSVIIVVLMHSVVDATL